MTANSASETNAIAATAGGTRTVHFEIYRYDPDSDAKPYMQKLEVQLQPTRQDAARRADAHQERLRRLAWRSAAAAAKACAGRMR